MQNRAASSSTINRSRQNKTIENFRQYSNMLKPLNNMSSSVGSYLDNAINGEKVKYYANQNWNILIQQYSSLRPKIMKVAKCTKESSSSIPRENTASTSNLMNRLKTIKITENNSSKVLLVKKTNNEEVTLSLKNKRSDSNSTAKLRQKVQLKKQSFRKFTKDLNSDLNIGKQLRSLDYWLFSFKNVKLKLQKLINTVHSIHYHLSFNQFHCKIKNMKYKLFIFRVWVKWLKR